MSKHPWKNARIHSQHDRIEDAKAEADDKFKHTNKKYKIALRGNVYQVWVKK